jgi:hypothetical protein
VVDLDAVAASTTDTAPSVPFEDLLPATFVGRTAENLSAVLQHSMLGVLLFSLGAHLTQRHSSSFKAY